ncbi:SLC26A1 [Acanthosepion pharaonis]|uniref:SLC26A1 n=1 Tax=Acanthosepion pharaonis TaxID=158019 RepID=A0A812BJW2_ACAPH|nr:SLC26A1 [Sepia pharaonis]
MLFSRDICTSIYLSIYLSIYQELYAYGITNIVISFFGCFTATGAVSRTSVQVGCGAKSQVSSLVGALFVLIVIFVAGPWLKTLPICVLSFGIGLLIGAVLGIISVIMRTLWVEAVSLGIINNTKVFLDQTKYQGVTLPAGIKVVSYSSPLYYANVDIFRNEIDSKTEKFKKVNKHSNGQMVSTDLSIIINPKSANSLHEDRFHQKIIIECSGISFIDRMGATALQQLYVEYKNKGISCLFSGVNDRVISVLKACGAFNTLQYVMYRTTYDAMLAAGFEENEINTRF